eukprot:gene2165-2119_t
MIELRGITQTYQGSQGPVEALKGIDLTIQPGEVFGIIGKSGAGKSSLVRVINLLNRPTTGQVIVGGQDLTQLNDAQLREARPGRIVEQGRVLDVFTRPQQAITKSLIDEILPQELPASVLDHVRKLAGQLGAGRTGQLLRLSYAGDSAYQPILSQLIRQFGVDMSILHGQVDEIQDETFGSLAVYASGEAESVRGAVAHLRAGGVEVEEGAHIMFNNFTPAMLDLFASSLWETLIMVGISGLVGGLLGVPLGVFLRLTDDGGVLENGPVNKLVGWLVNAVRSTPFIILLVAIIPFTRFITGSSIGTAAAVVPLTIAAAPFVARLVEAALREVDHGLVEAAQAMGATTSQIVWKVLLPEALPGIVAGLTITFVSLTGYSAMAGAIGGGGLGDLGIRYGYQRFLPEIMLAVVLVLIFFVQAVQSLGDWAVRKLSHR